jgi:hypothetical protein
MTFIIYILATLHIQFVARGGQGGNPCQIVDLPKLLPGASNLPGVFAMMILQGVFAMMILICTFLLWARTLAGMAGVHQIHVRWQRKKRR